VSSCKTPKQWCTLQALIIKIVGARARVTLCVRAYIYYVCVHMCATRVWEARLCGSRWWAISSNHKTTEFWRMKYLLLPVVDTLHCSKLSVSGYTCSSVAPNPLCQDWRQLSHAFTPMDLSQLNIPGCSQKRHILANKTRLSEASGCLGCFVGSVYCTPTSTRPTQGLQNPYI
jgi:hypothetical protein